MMFEKIKRWYQQGLWTERMVNNAVEKGVLTAGQGREILGESHETS